MYAVPDVEEVMAVAKKLGIHLGPEEAALYRKYLMEQLHEFDTFVQARVEESKPPMVSATRTPGHRPRPGEDPLNAWMWKCRIEGAAGGLLAGKTVSYKDHIAVAGMPMSFGAFARERGLGRADGVVRGDGHLGDVGTQPGEDVDRRQHQVTHVALGLVEALLEHAEAQPGYSVS